MSEQLPTDRPVPTPALSAGEFRRWYWRQNELQAFARHLGIRATGSKQLLAARIEAKLEDRPFAEPTPTKTSSSVQLSGALSADTVIPKGQRCSQIIRGWMVAQVGPGFHFDAVMRAFFATTDGTQTMQDALDHWNTTRNQPEQDIGEQFEYNRFTRAWHQQHPGGTRAQLLAAWCDYRLRPSDTRDRA
ncbi:MAG: SAP domain-containing protein [Propionibacteriaceae bacterium]|nr:SAP domain-containing protein [Propionibacteriaceae bacterium]